MTLAEFQSKISTYWTKNVQNRSNHPVMTLKQAPSKSKPIHWWQYHGQPPEPDERHLTEIIIIISKHEAVHSEERTSCVGGVRMCTLCGRELGMMQTIVGQQAGLSMRICCTICARTGHKASYCRVVGGAGRGKGQGGQRLPATKTSMPKLWTNQAIFMFNCPNNQMPPQMNPGQQTYPTSPRCINSQSRGHTMILWVNHMVGHQCPTLQIMPQTSVTEGQTNQSNCYPSVEW